MGIILSTFLDIVSIKRGFLKDAELSKHLINSSSDSLLLIVASGHRAQGFVLFASLIVTELNRCENATFQRGRLSTGKFRLHSYIIQLGKWHNPK